MSDLTGKPWTNEEVEAIVSKYMEMLKMDLSGEAFVKAHQNDELRQRLRGRSNASVEYKHRNISAVMAELGWQYLRGYRPAANLQRSLRDEVERVLRLDGKLDTLAAKAASAPIDLSTATEPKVAAPPEAVFGEAKWTPRKIGVKRDYVYQDQRNRQLGLSGELAAVKFEQRRLTTLGRADLASKVEHVAVTVGDGLGYDVKSFETNGADRHIEVKTTTHPAETAFFVSSNEVAASAYFSDSYFLYRFYKFSSSTGIYVLPGSLEDSCFLRPQSFIALPR
ncbi:DUF3883 domain-containing protein [Salinibacterium sp. SWN139]|uniref:DUF3883 domain-containing protein n=1 Tax=Salinibacterium sp. SWN139 TaxID=2792055 RepID=UPI0018CFA8DA|nr:DUF3883 domain-containing protein [Salinibacterium sp. SWN139]MBH0053227.1 DUF3883 domain-containing protein [Salinibacterium sp. SWN139]